MRLELGGPGRAQGRRRSRSCSRCSGRRSSSRRPRARSSCSSGNPPMLLLTALWEYSPPHARIRQARGHVRGAQGALRGVLRVYGSDAAAPDEKLPGSSAPQWGLGLTFGDADAFGIAPDATTAEQVFDFVYTLGPMYIEKHFASSGSVQLALKKYKEVHAFEETNGDEIAITIIDGLGTCSAPPGFETVELNIPRRRLAIGARFNARNGTPEQVKQLLAKYIKNVLSLYSILEKGFAGADASDVVDMAIELAASLDCAAKPLTGLFDRLNRSQDCSTGSRSSSSSTTARCRQVTSTSRDRPARGNAHEQAPAGGVAARR
eukprot:3745288-Prymnesium_polylepis.2